MWLALQKISNVNRIIGSLDGFFTRSSIFSFTLAFIRCEIKNQLIIKTGWLSIDWEALKKKPPSIHKKINTRMSHLHNTKSKLAHPTIFFRISKCPCASRKVPSYARVSTGFKCFQGTQLGTDITISSQVVYKYIINEVWWRRRRDSNPRDPSGPTPLAGERLRPLGHVSADPFSGELAWGQGGFS